MNNFDNIKKKKGKKKKLLSIFELCRNNIICKKLFPIKKKKKVFLNLDRIDFSFCNYLYFHGMEIYIFISWI